MLVTQMFRARILNKITYNFAIKKFNLPDLGEKIKEGKIQKWYIKSGDKVEQYQKIADITSDKQFTQLTASDSGKITKLFHQEGQLCQVGEPLFQIDILQEGKSSSDVSQNNNKQSKQISQKNQDINKTNDLSEVPDKFIRNKLHATPSVRQLLLTHKIDISNIKGTGKHHRVLRQDVLNFIENKSNPNLKQTKQSKSPINPSTLVKKTIQMNGYEKGMQKTMTESNTIPHLSYKEEYDLTDLMQFREKSKNSIKDKITYMSYFIKSFSLALRDYPKMNALYQLESPFHYNIIENHNITIAIDSPNGLAVPNIKNVQDLSIVEVQRQLNRLRKAAQQGKIERKDLEGGTISMSNIGTIGGTYARPLILSPQVAIVALGKTRRLPRLISSSATLIPRNIMSISFSADHRVIDGGTVANFSNKWKQYLQNPASILLQLR